MRLVSCERDGRRFAGVLRDERVVPFEGVAELDGAAIGALADLRLRPADAVPVEDVRLRPVVPRPGRIVCLGLNYGTHVDETKRDLPAYPVLFAKYPESLVGAYDDIVLPPESAQVDYEAELAVIIGRSARRVGEAEAMRVVAGYAVANDVTMRDFQYRSHQWLQGKTWPSSTPLGPALVTTDEVGDPHDLPISLELNGRRLQEATTGAMLFSLPAIVARLSEFMTLQPGDVVLTGTPGGVGYRRDPQVFLGPGDEVVVEIGGIGRLSNRAVAEVLPA